MRLLRRLILARLRALPCHGLQLLAPEAPSEALTLEPVEVWAGMMNGYGTQSEPGVCSEAWSYP